MVTTRKITVLIIEDSPTVRLYYRKIFESKGFEVIEAENGQNGWILAYERVPDIIVLDMVLPDLHGLEILKKIRGNETTKNIPILVLTSVKELNEVQKAINLGANYYSVKGSDSPEKIMNMIYKLLKRASEKSSESEQTNIDDTQSSKRPNNEEW